MPPGSKRFWELDAARGIAVALMVCYHFVFDLKYFGIADLLSPQAMFWIPRAIGGLFLLIFGISLSISYARNGGMGAKALAFKELNRAAFLAAVACAITIATMIYPGEGAIVFGIMHLMALCAVLSLAFRDFGRLNLLFGIILVLAGSLVATIQVGTPWLLWLGLAPAGFYSLDYYPLLPWFGVVLIGMFLGKKIYKDPRCAKAPTFQTGERAHRGKTFGLLPEMQTSPRLQPWVFDPNARRALRAPAQNPQAGMLAWAGGNSLAIYLLHQPILVGAIAVLKYLLH